MELGEKIRSARLEKGLSQRAVCGTEITRNMLSQIENGSARPSMSTLRYLAGVLEKPVAYFLDEQAVTSPNASVMASARSATPKEALEILETYRENDAAFDPERYLLEALSCLRLAEEALKDGKVGYAAALLERAARAGSRSPYYTEELERKRLILCYRAAPEKAGLLAAALPPLTDELLLRAEAALGGGDPRRAAGILREEHTPEANYLKGRAWILAGEYRAALECLHLAEPVMGSRVYPLLESCYKSLEDYKMAYEYACKQR